ncbi:MAG: DUF354 domain-containing protein, partial [Bacilli bacterium]
NICPKGRKLKNVHPFISSFVYFFITIYRLWKFTRGKKYDLFISDDLLGYIGRLKAVPTYVFIDDDLSVVKLSKVMLTVANKIIAPDITELQQYNAMKIGFPSYKELAYLHPNVFSPNIEIVRHFNPQMKRYFIIRLVSLRAYHDVGMKGITNKQVNELISLLETSGDVYISAERELPAEFEKYRLQINPRDISHVLYYADMFIGDSQTMSSEASLLGIPTLKCNDFTGKISVMNEKEEKYGLMYSYPPKQFDLMMVKIEELLKDGGLKDTFIIKREKMLNDKIDLSAFFIWLFENFKNTDLNNIDYDQFRNRIQ